MGYPFSIRIFIKFLSSASFALLLIFLSAAFVIAGTFIESKTGSHQRAEDWIYHHPIFNLLLAGYFVNILLSALSRYPFKKRHIPFLITHLGLLMMILGVFVKIQWGTQGHINLIEGTASDDLTHPYKPALIIENRLTHRITSKPLEEVAILEHYPHAKSYYTFASGSLPADQLKEWVAYDRGFQGYSIVTEEITLSPPLQLMKTSAEKRLIDFQKSAALYLKNWEDHGSWLFNQPFSAKLDWQMVPLETVNALYWIAELFDETHFLENLKQNNWPLLAQLEQISDKKDQYRAFMTQLFSIQNALPEAPTSFSSIREAQMLSAYLRLFPPIPQTKEEPLSHHIEQDNLPLKKEEAIPGMVISFLGEKIPLIYDPTRAKLKWPTQDGKYLLSFQPAREKLPYFVRLHKAQEIKYPGSAKTASFECALSLYDKKTGAITFCNLQMNHVYETPDGYRFYLSGMGTIDSYQVRSIQLVVNKDPAKMALTYPGAILIALGIFLLFFGKKRQQS